MRNRQENSMNSDYDKIRKIIELEDRVRDIEEEVEGVEPPKSREMKKIEELEEKIDKLVESGVEEEESRETKQEIEELNDFMPIEEEEKEKEEEEESSRELASNETRCPHCGKIFDNRGYVHHKGNCPEAPDKEEEDESELELSLMKRDLPETHINILERLSTDQRKTSKYIARGLEDQVPHNVHSRVKRLKEQGLIKSPSSEGYLLTEKGKKLLETDEYSFDSYVENQQLETDHYDMSERVQKLIELLEQHEAPLFRDEMATQIYRLPDDKDISSGDTYYNLIEGALSKLKEKGLIEKAPNDRYRKRSTPYRLKPEAVEGSADNDSSLSEDQKFENAKNNASVSDKDIDVVMYALGQLIHEEEKDEITYQDFEKYYDGNTNPLRMFQKLFSNTDLMGQIMQRVAPEKNHSWKKKESGKFQAGEKNWVLKLS